MSSKNKRATSFPRIEASRRWVRGQLGETFVVDSKRPLLVWEHPYYPTYFFPFDDVRMELLEEMNTADSKTDWDMTVNQQRVHGAAYQYPYDPELKGYIAFRWGKLDRWYEEDEEVFVHARDPYKRVDVIPSTRRLRVVIDGTTVADTKRPHLLFETTIGTRYYIPAQDVDMTYLTPTDTKTRCPYKGIASYWRVSVGDKVYNDQVWSYLDPIPECPKIKGLFCFYTENTQMYLNDELLDNSM